MASLRDTVKDYQDELRGGIAWVAFWREGRSWNAEYFYIDPDDILTAEDRNRLKEIRQADPAAVVLNSYYCGQLAEDMTVDELAAGVRHHYEQGFNGIEDFIEAHDNRLSPEEIEKGRAIAHAAGLPFSEKPYRGEDFNPYIYDGSMSIEDYELMHRLIEQERSERMAEKPIISGYLSNLGKYAEGRPAGEWVGFPTTAERMKEAFARIGLDFKTYEEWHFTEFQSSVPRLAEHLPEHAHLDELNYLSALLSAMDGGEREKFSRRRSSMGSTPGTCKTLSTWRKTWTATSLSPTCWTRGMIDELETIKLPEEAKPYFDYEGYGGDTIINQGGELTRFGYIYNNRSPFTEYYNGRDVPEEYRVTPTPPEPEREGPDFEAAAPAAPRPVAPILLASDKPGDKMKEITGRLEQGIT